MIAARRKEVSLALPRERYTPELLKSFVLSEPLKMVGYGIGCCSNLASCSVLRHIPAADQYTNGFERQLLSIAVDPQIGRLGVGTGLFNALWFRQGRGRFWHYRRHDTDGRAALLRPPRRSKVGEMTLGGLSSIRFHYTLPSRCEVLAP